MKKIIKLTEKDLTKIIKMVIREQEENDDSENKKIIEKMKRIEKHFFNRIRVIKNFDDIPKKFKRIFTQNPGRDAEKYVKKYMDSGTMFVIKTPYEKDFLVHMDPSRIVSVDEGDRPYKDEELEKLLRLNSFGVTLRELLTHIKNRKKESEPKKPEN